ncbi:MAG TPA: hypothetical protein VK826_16020 [Bacteroidia bacterium]|nr:hypothetical protein [Bacteroidia bacterium]
MKTFVRIAAIVLTIVLILLGTMVCVFTGYAFIFVFPGFLAVVLICTIITQIMLFVLARSAKNLFYEFFYCCAFTASILLTWGYGACVFIIKSMNDSDRPYYNGNEGILDMENLHLFFGIHLLLLLPVVLQIVLAVWKSKQSARVMQQ